MVRSSDQSIRRQISGPLKGIRTNFPDETFDALNATPRDLALHFLPPRPDARYSPTAHANWVRAMASRPRFPPNTPTAPSTGDRISIGDVLIFTHPNQGVSQASSRNWSGAFIRSRNFDHTVLAQGRWIVPDTPAFEGPSFASSIWVGLDGSDPGSRIMPQIGTGQLARLYEFPVPLPLDIQFAWWQLWLRDFSAGRQILIPIAITRKDRIYAQVLALSSEVVSFYLKNETTNRAYAAYYYLRDDIADSMMTLERRTAEWIVERPRIPDRLGPGDKLIDVAMADYGETAFTDCNAATLSADDRLQEFQLQRARLIKMNLWDDDLHPGRLASKPERVGDDAIQMTYVDSPRAV